MSDLCVLLNDVDEECGVVVLVVTLGVSEGEWEGE